MSENNWALSIYEEKETIYYAINEVTGVRKMRRIFEMQIPRNTMFCHNKWSDYAREIIDLDLDKLIKILPVYMQNICNEHNGLKRISDFPNFQCGYIKYTPTSISIGADGSMLQIGGCHSDDVGSSFTKYFVNGLKGNWEGICFTGCDNPEHNMR